jgi:MFS transporter, DHA1 family, inner membrane transport protein
MGLLPVIAANLQVSIPAAGLMSAYAIGVVLGAPVTTLTTRRLSRRSLLMGLSAIFTLGNMLAAFTATVCCSQRVITSFNHGAFFGVGAVRPPVRCHRTSAPVPSPPCSWAGLPLATWAAAQFGWRPVFWAIAGVGLATLGALSLTLPRQPAPRDSSLGAELRCSFAS